MDTPIEVGEDALTVYNVQELDMTRNRRLAAEKAEMSTASAEISNSIVPDGSPKSERSTVLPVATTVADERPPCGYSREEVIALMKSNEAPNKNLCTFFNQEAFETVRYVNTECIYSREEMIELAQYPDYIWNREEKRENMPLLIMERHFPGVRREKKMISAEYWIWHNVNAQQSFAVYWKFFPFHLPHFDAEAFISVARLESLVPAYLISRLYQEHLMLREEKELVPYEKKHEDNQRRMMIAAYQRHMARFPLTDEHSLVYYEDSERNLQSCSLEQAMNGLRAVHFTSQMKFAVSPKDDAVRDKEWMVYELSDLIARNGKAMPFLFYLPTHTDKMNEKEEIRQLKEEMADLNKRRSDVADQIQRLSERSAAAAESMQRIAEKFPPLAMRSAQTNATLAVATKVEPVSLPQPAFVPKPGVDIFAMLKPILHRWLHDSAAPKVDSSEEIEARMEQMRKSYDKCDKKALVQRTANMINKYRPANCQLCDLKTESASTFIEHITCKKHVNKLSAVCSNALNFWLDAIKECTKTSKGLEISPLTILTFCSRLAKPHPNLEQAATEMQRKLKNCDKKFLDGEPELRALFSSSVSCSVCIRRVSIDKPANLIAHFVTQGHITAATKNGGQVHADVIDFWTRALDQATVSENHY